MRSFTDSTGERWEINVTLGTRELLKNRCNVDIVAESGSSVSDLINALIFDFAKFADLMFVILEKQREDKGISPQELAARFDGATVDNAQQAAVEAFCDFFLQSRRCHRSTALRESLELLTMAVDKATEEVKEKSQTVKSSIAISGNLQELSDSIQDRSPIASCGVST